MELIGMLTLLYLVMKTLFLQFAARFPIQLANSVDPLDGFGTGFGTNSCLILV